MSKSGNSEQMYYVALIWKDFQNLSYFIGDNNNMQCTIVINLN